MATTPPIVSIAEVMQFYELYKIAWEQRDVDLVLTLFTPDVSYREKHFGHPLRGHTRLRSYWQDRVYEHQRDISFSFQVWGVKQNEAIAFWQASFDWLPINAIMELNGVTRCVFSDRRDGHLICSAFHEWIDMQEVI